jgi:hypothetical protein
MAGSRDLSAATHFGRVGRLDAAPVMDATTWARLLAVEVLLAEPELLGNDALEADLYILRDDLRNKVQAAA